VVSIGVAFRISAAFLLELFVVDVCMRSPKK